MGQREVRECQFYFETPFFYSEKSVLEVTPFNESFTVSFIGMLEEHRVIMPEWEIKTSLDDSEKSSNEVMVTLSDESVDVDKFCQIFPIEGKNNVIPKSYDNRELMERAFSRLVLTP